MSSRPRTSSGTLHHLKTIPAVVDVSVDTQASEHHRPSFSHSASTTSTMSRDGGSTGHSTPQEEAVDPNAKDSASAQEQNKTAPPQKKKKGQRFFCTDFPPCNLSFTRSEHLARHIRKHTGERPFQCHCTRRFSRLDNLRQHAQTVHCNEPIPPDSLANTGSSRFARAARSERARKQSRVHVGRGHGRNLSTSSISSVLSTYSQGHDLRRRPPPLIISSDGTARARMSLDASADPLSPPSARTGPHWIPGPSPTSAGYASNSPFSATPEGGHVPSQPPNAAFWEHRRRMSVPAAGSSYPPPTYVPRHLSQTYSSPEEQTAYPPPTNGGFVEPDPRRRTWHPSPNEVPNFSPHSRPSTSGSEQYWYPNPVEVPPQYTFHQPDYNAPRKDEAQPATTLPGIESFDQPPPPRDPLNPEQGGNPSPNHPELPDRRASVYPCPYETRAAGPPVHGHRRGTMSFDAGIRSELNKLELNDASPKRDNKPIPHPPARKNEWKAESSPVSTYVKRTDQIKAPAVITTEIPLPGKLDTNRLDVLVAVATGEARAS
ncbi:hypothetical protein KEM56_001002 [Ascosphaera pollenicola]|nr:hypothetical protein KEM56_001002 [Ascosphaera pollenicola]